ncbi:tricarballylate utilization 4Fe-4S protein TcuB [Pararhodospirillum oryzae]|uniref:Tricarballylate utilization protein B n=1 Tax=Pararhodospirillum oryzae TaxID=478448 RepID=A0A512H3U5_9PROT|nr:tricarballylate utilization 4Fe-4S protein TcuB [Pararhodospirillum oryzae]GEO80103.1 hypothetical protein ROR02_02340 [Pararhodospirillum oryzae]
MSASSEPPLGPSRAALRQQLPRPPAPPAPDPLMDEARRVLTVCNVCAYCTGYCETFRAARRCPRLTDADIYYLAVLCHNCRSCWYACQYAPPNTFGLNVPAVLARVRQRAYRTFAWPPGLGGRGVGDGVPGVVAVLIAVLAILVVPGLVLLGVPPTQLFGLHLGPGAFYEVISLETMTALGGITLGLGALSLLISTWRFWHAISAGRRGSRLRAWPRALREAFALPNLLGGGPGCTDRDSRPSGLRRRFHQALVGGVGLCLASTLAASMYHHVFGWVAPYSWLSLPVLLGTAGGVLILVAAAALFVRRQGADPAPTARETLVDDTAFLGLLSAVAASGLALLLARATSAMGLMLALHLGTVAGLFLTLALGKFRHAPFRLAALLRASLERPHDR